MAGNRFEIDQRGVAELMRSLQLEFDKHSIRVPIEADIPGMPDIDDPITLEGRVFISYAREDRDRVDRLQRKLVAARIPVWRDTANLWPGEDWRIKIRRAITDDALAFLACFSTRSLAREKGYQNEELLLAIEQHRQRQPDIPWLIPVRFDDCALPDLDLGPGRTLNSFHAADLFGQRVAEGTARLISTILEILRRKSAPAVSVPHMPLHSRPNLEVSIAVPDETDSDFRSVRSVVYVRTTEPISDLTATYLTDQNQGGTTDLGHGPFHISTSLWRVRSDFLLRSVRDVIIGYTTVVEGQKVQRFQWDGFDYEYDWEATGADGSPLSAFLQIRRRALIGNGASRVTQIDGPSD